MSKKLREKLKEDIIDRALFEGYINEENPLKTLGRRIIVLNIEDVLDKAIETIYIHTRQGHRDNDDQVALGELALAIGKPFAARAIKQYMPDTFDGSRKMTPNQEKGATARTPWAARIGAFVTYSFERLKLIEKVETRAKNGHSNYFIRAKNDKQLTSLRATIEVEKTNKYPNIEGPYPDWRGPTNHGYKLIKTQDPWLMGHTIEEEVTWDEYLQEPRVLKHRTPNLNAKSFPTMFRAVNESQQVGWKINKEMLEIFEWALRNQEDAFGDIWAMTNPQAKKSKLMEAEAVLNTAYQMGDEEFFHLYYYDFRGRKYPATAYLHEQGTDGAKGLLLTSQTKPIGEGGLFWLMVNAANNWADKSNNPPDENGEVPKTDKIPIEDRYQFALDNWEGEWQEWAADPYNNKGWMAADKPWQFLSTLLEIRNAAMLDDPFSYETGFVVYIDGTNNGCQHLSAMTSDEVTGVQVNVSGTDAPYAGDLYAYVADAVWEGLEDEIDEETKERCDKYIDTLLELKSRITQVQFEIKEKAVKFSDEEHPLIKERTKLIEHSRKLRKDHDDISEETCKVFWARINDKKHRRKVVKRNVMTLPYGGTEYGLGEQQIKDARKHGIDLLTELEHKWGSYMGRRVFAGCKTAIPKPMRMLEVFEEAGIRAETRDECLEWRVPVTGFPVKQYYMEGTVKRIDCNYGDKPASSGKHRADRVQFKLPHEEDLKVSKGKQSQSASPNVIHSLDAAHLAMTQLACKDECGFDLITVHDSFGSHPSDMQNLFHIVREQFVRLYLSQPLENLLDQLEVADLEVVKGNLVLEDVLENEFAFS